MSACEWLHKQAGYKPSVRAIQVPEVVTYRSMKFHSHPDRGHQSRSLIDRSVIFQKW